MNGERVAMLLVWRLRVNVVRLLPAASIIAR
jgi:hypothetical protein